MKKILSILLAAALIVCTFAACGNKKPILLRTLHMLKIKERLLSALLFCSYGLL